MAFRVFLETEEKKDVARLIARLPAGHRKLLDGYKFRFQPGNTLKGDGGHVGQVYQDKITVAAPWRYGREFTVLHEVGHLVYEFILTPALKKKWADLFKKEKAKGPKHAALDQSAEEIFCMTYAACYSTHPPVTYHKKPWIDFIKSLPG